MSEEPEFLRTKVLVKPLLYRTRLNFYPRWGLQLDWAVSETAPKANAGRNYSKLEKVSQEVGIEVDIIPAGANEHYARRTVSESPSTCNCTRSFAWNPASKSTRPSLVGLFPGLYIFGHTQAYLFRCVALSPAWYSIPSIPAVPKTLQKSLDWLTRQVSKLLLVLKKSMGFKNFKIFLDALLLHSEDKITKKDRAIIDLLKQQYATAWSNAQARKR